MLKHKTYKIAVYMDMDSTVIAMFTRSNLKLNYMFLFTVRFVHIRTPDLDAFDPK